MTRDSTAPPPADALDEPAATEPAPQVRAELPPPFIDEGSAADLIPLSRLPKDAEIDPAKLDQDALKVVLRLTQHGHQAYLVGGCVRDLLVGKRPKDFDVATSAHPGEVRATFRNCRLIGRRF